MLPDKLGPYVTTESHPLSIEQDENTSVFMSATSGAVPDIVVTMARHMTLFASHVAIEHHQARSRAGLELPPMTFTFQQVNDASDRIARAILDHGAQHPVLPIISSKHPAAYVAMLAALKLGLAFAPIDPYSTPIARQLAVLKQILDNVASPHVSAPLVTLMDRENFQAFSSHMSEQRHPTLPLNALILEDLLDSAIQPEQDTFIPVSAKHLDASSPAYIIFTSGSTGTPKGIVMSRTALSAGIHSLTRLVPRSSQAPNKMIQFSPIHFDVSLLEIFYCFAPSSIHAEQAPCTLVSAPYLSMLQDLTSLFVSASITHACLTPTVATLVDPHRCPSLVFLACSGEAVPDALVQRWIKASHLGYSASELWGGYGPSETFFTSLRPLTASWIDSVPHLSQPKATASKDLGPPLLSCHYAVLHPQTNQPVPIGQVGELWVGGPQVMNRYLGQDHLTATAVRSDTSGRPWYRTGDLVKMLPGRTGTIVFHSRSGSSGSFVKHNGLRMELEEIDSVASLHPLVTTARTIIAKHAHDNETQHIITFVKLTKDALEAEQATVDFDRSSSALQSSLTVASQEFRVQLWSRLAEHLPSYMLPSFLVPVRTIPLAQTGKMDVRQLEQIFGQCKPAQLQQFASLLGGEHKEAGATRPIQASELVKRITNELIDRGYIQAIKNEIPSDAKCGFEQIARYAQEPLSTFGVDSLGRIKVGALLYATFGSRAQRARAKIVRSDATIEQLAELIDPEEQGKPGAITASSPCALWPSTREKLAMLQTLEKITGLSEEHVEAIGSCSPIQVDLIAAQLRSDAMQGELVDHLSFTLDKQHSDYTPDASLYHQAFAHLLHLHAILRAIFVPADAERNAMAQVTLKLDAYVRLQNTQCDSDSAPFFQPCATLTVLEDADGSADTLSFRLNHAVYDGFSLPIILRDFQQSLASVKAGSEGLRSATTSPPSDYRNFVAFVGNNEERKEANAYFARKLVDYKPLSFPRYEDLLLPQHAEVARPHCSVEATVQISLPTFERDYARRFGLAGDVTVGASALLQACLAAALSDVARSDHASYALLCSGRRLSLDGIDEIVGPTLSTSVMHARQLAGLDSDLATLAARLAQDAMDSERYASYLTMHEKLSACTDASSSSAHAEMPRVLFSLQTFPEHENASGTAVTDDLLKHKEVGLQNLIGYAIVAEACLVRDMRALPSKRLQLRCRYDPSRLTEEDAVSLLKKWTTATGQLASLTQTSFKKLGREIDDKAHDVRAKPPIRLSPPRRLLVHEYFSDQARATPSKIAIQFQTSRFVTFRDLLGMAEHLRTALEAHGPSKPRPDGIHSILIDTRVGRTPEAVALMLACAQLGTPFVFVDFSGWPPAMVKSVVEQAAPHMCVCANGSQVEEVTRTIPTLANATFSLSGLSQMPQDGLDRACDVHHNVHPSTPLYYIFTSGTTGTPKGVEINHSNLTHLVQGASLSLQSRFTDRWLLSSSWTFDASLLEAFVCLLSGGCLCMDDPDKMLVQLEVTATELRASFAQLTPTVASLVEPTKMPYLTSAILGGEALTPMLAKRWSEELQLYNCYGPTECTVIASMHPITREPKPYITIGRAFGHNKIEILSADSDEPVAEGGVGEICIFGPQLGSYINPGIARSQSFSARQKSPASERFYRTGDLGLFNADGTICCLGRRDSELKVRGQRINSNAVASTIMTSSSLIKCALVDLFSLTDSAGSSDSGEKLIAFFTIQGQNGLGGSASSTDDLELCQEAYSTGLVAKAFARCRETLKEASVPAWILAMNSIPRTASGKVNARALQDFARRSFKTGVLQSTVQPAKSQKIPNTAGKPQYPSCSTARAIKDTWLKLLGLSNDFDPDATIAQLGGDSITMIKMAGELSSRGLTCSFSDLAHNNSLVKLSELLKKRSASSERNSHVTDLEQIDLDYRPFTLLDGDGMVSRLCEAAEAQLGISKSSVQDILPATPMQTSLYVVSEQHPELYFDDFNYMWDEHHSLDEDIVLEAIHSVLETHAILRTELLLVDSIVFQLILDTATALSRADSTSASSGFGFHVDVARRSLSFRVHHSLFDGWSWNLLEEELQVRLSALAKASKGTTEISKVLPFSALTASMLSETLKDNAARYWNSYLEGSTLSSFPGKGTGFQENDSIKHFSSERIVWHLPPSVDRSAKSGTTSTLSDTVRCAVGMAIATADDLDDVLLGVVSSGRAGPYQGIERVAGPCLVTVPLRIPVHVARAESLSALVERVRAQHIESIPHEQLGLRSIINASQYQGSREIFDVLLTFVNLEERESQTADVLTRVQAELREETLEQPYALTLEIFQRGSTLTLTAKYDTAILLDKDVHWLLKHIVTAMELILSEPTCKFHPAMLIGAEEVATIDSFSPKTPLDVPFATLPEMFLHKADKLWCKIALVDEHFRHVSYGELFVKAFRGAQMLRRSGVKPGQIVPLLMHKSLDLYFAIFSVTLCGAAFANLSLEAPRAQLEYSIDELLQAEHAIVDDDAEAWVSDLVARPIKLSQLMFAKPILEHEHRSRSKIIQSPEVAEMVALTVEDAACYIGLTSGTSGRPKAVQVAHYNIVAFLEGGRDAFLLDWSSRNLAYASHTFDAFYQDIFVTLLVHGATLVVASKDTLMSDLEGFMDRFDVSDAHLTPTVSMLVEPTNVPKLRSILITGEQVTPAVRKRWIESGATTQNAYGPSETSVGVSTHSFTTGSAPPFIAMGKPFGDTRMHIVDEELRLLPIGAVGEIVVSGPQVACYLRSGSADAFQASPFCQGQRLYHTGDLGRLHGDGSFECLGRRDFQVKLHGQRIEAEAVVSVILEAGKDMQLRESAVSVLGMQGQQRLVAFVVFERDDRVHKRSGKFVGSKELPQLLPRIRKLRSSIGTQLSSYMVPTFWVPLTSLPRNTSNKLDRKALSTLVDDEVREAIVSAEVAVLNLHQSASPLEKQIRAIWADLLDQVSEAVPLEATYSSMGIDSLGLIRLNSMLRNAGLRTSVSLLVANPTIASFASATAVSSTEVEAAVRPAADASAEGTKRAPVCEAPASSKYRNDLISAGIHVDDVDDVVPGTPPQRNLWTAIEQDAKAYRSSFAYTTKCPKDANFRSAIQAAWERVLEMHPILRVVFIPCSDVKVGVLQVLMRTAGPQQFTVQGLGDHIIETSDAPVMCALHCPESRGDQESTGEIDVVLVLHLSHLCYDAWSMEIVERDFGEEIRRSFSASTASILRKPDRPSYLELSRLYSPDSQRRAAERWEAYLQGARLSSFPVPAESLESAMNDYERVSSVKVKRKVDAALLATRLKISPATLLQAALAIVLSQHDDNAAEVIFGQVASGRTLDFEGVEEVVGPCMVTVPMRVHVDQQATLVSYLNHVAGQFSNLVAHHCVDMRSIIRASPFPTAPRLFSVLLTFTDQDGSLSGTAPCQVLERAESDEAPSDHARKLQDLRIPCVVEAAMRDGAISLVCLHNEDFLSRVDAEHFTQSILDCIGRFEDMSSNTDSATIGSLDLTAPRERDLRGQISTIELAQWEGQHTSVDVGLRSEVTEGKAGLSAQSESQTNLPRSPGQSTSTADRSAAEGGFERSKGQTWRAESYQLEQVLGSVLAEILQLPVGSLNAQLHFALLGADSLTLMRFSSALRRRGIKVTVKMLTQHNSISKLVEAIESQGLHSHATESVSEDVGDGSKTQSLAKSLEPGMLDPLSSKETGGTVSRRDAIDQSTVKPPSDDFYIPVSLQSKRKWLFMVHDYTGFVQAYNSLARNSSLSSRFNIYSIMDPDLGSSDSRYEDLEAMALSYLVGALRVMSSSDCGFDLTLGGWSFGGMIALEMTRLVVTKPDLVLAAAGLPRSTPLRLLGLVMLDSFLWPSGVQPSYSMLSSSTGPVDERERLLTTQRAKAARFSSTYQPDLHRSPEFKVCLVKAALQEGWQQRSGDVKAIETSPFNGWDRAIPRNRFRLGAVSSQHGNMFDHEHEAETSRVLAELLDD